MRNSSKGDLMDILLGYSSISEDSLNEISVRISDVIKEGFNFLTVEASEIFAFVATDADRVLKPGIPPHIPIAYGLRDSSMSAEIMRNMINDQ